jgi:hypothetical protein
VFFVLFFIIICECMNMFCNFVFVNNVGEYQLIVIAYNIIPVLLWALVKKKNFLCPSMNKICWIWIWIWIWIRKKLTYLYSYIYTSINSLKKYFNHANYMQNSIVFIKIILCV